MLDSFRRYSVEFLGTYFLVFTVCACVLFGLDSTKSAFAIGLILMVAVYAGGYISGGHYNPAVTLASALRGSMCCKDLFPYWIAQTLGAVAATYTVLPFAQNKNIETGCPYSLVALFTGEFIFTFILCYAALSTTTSPETENNSYYGIAIGSVVTIGILTVGGTLCYGAMNPVVALSLGLTGTACLGLIGLTAAINLFAGLVAAYVFKFTSNE